jgi:hypothetical protein
VLALLVQRVDRDDEHGDAEDGQRNAGQPFTATAASPLASQAA